MKETDRMALVLSVLIVLVLLLAIGGFRCLFEITDCAKCQGHLEACSKEGRRAR